MKLGIIIPHDTCFDIVARIVVKEFPFIQPTVFFYGDYKDVANTLKIDQERFDALLFSGPAPFGYAKHHVKQKNIWDYLERYSGALLRAMLDASRRKYDLQAISYDYYDAESLEEIYNEQQMHIDRKLVLSNKNICQDTEGIEHYNETVYEFHKYHWTHHHVECCITSCYTASKWLQRDHIPAIFVYPTGDICRETLRRIYAEYTVKLNQKSQIVILSLEIGFPSEYSMFAKDECGYLQDKVKISSYIYSFAEQLDATVVEVTYRNYLIFTTRSILETVTDNLSSFELLTEISKQYLSTISIGIGYGMTARQAKDNANKGLIHAKMYNTDVAFVFYSDQVYQGPVGLNPSNEEIDAVNVNDKITAVSKKSSVSMQNIFKLYNILNKTDRKTFTIKEMSELMEITERSVNRIVNKLETAGYAKVVGQQPAYKIGRPSRIVQININFN